VCAVHAVGAATLQVHVNYAHDWVAGATDPGVTVDVVVQAGDSTVKDTATVTADGVGNFFVGCEHWDSGFCPQIIPGDIVTVDVVALGLQNGIEPVGFIESLPDAAENTVEGTLDADWFTGPLDVWCEIWAPAAPAPIETSAATDGGTFFCDFDDVGWDLERGDMVAVSYFEPDGDRITNIVIWPWTRVNTTHDWAGGNYPAGHPVTVTVTDDLGSLKAEASLESDWGAGWGEDGFNTAPEHWSPGLPDLLAGDILLFEVLDHGYTHELTAGDIDASVDVAADTVTGTVDASWITEPVTVECHPWGAWAAGMGWVPIKGDTVDPDGLDTFTCDWGPGGEWDIMPAQEIAVMYVEPDDDDRVMEVVHDPAPQLRVWTHAEGAPGAGGNFVLRIEYENVGDAAAEDVTITSTFEQVVDPTPIPGGMSYLSDTSAASHTGSGSGPIAWDLGTVNPGEHAEFQMFVEVTGAVDDVVRHTAEIATSSFDTGPPEEKAAVWEGVVQPSDVQLNVTKHPWTPDPAAGSSALFSLMVCNNGPTGSTEVTLVDSMSSGLTLDTWWAPEPGWIEDSSSATGMTLSTPSIPGGACREVLVRTVVDGGLSPDDPLTNEVSITASNDQSTGDDVSTWVGAVGAPHVNVWVHKQWMRGVLVPGGRVWYGIDYGNNGNQSVAPVRIVDTLPPGTSYVHSWHAGGLGTFDLVPVSVTAEHVVWELPEVPNGYAGHIEVELAIDPTATAGAVLTNTAQICGAAAPPDPCAAIAGEDTYDDNVSSITDSLNPAGPNLRVRKGGQWVGEQEAHYTVRFENIGDATIPDVVVVDTLPDGSSWGGWWMLMFPPERLAADIDDANGVLTWTFTEIHPGEVAELVFNVVLDGFQQHLQWFTNTVEITLPVGDTSPPDNAFVHSMVWGNDCQHEHEDLSGHTWDGPFWCLAPGSITASSATVTGDGHVTLMSPSVTLGNGVAVQPGGSLTVGAP
jgi:uncharacterized repeat protein (TIGR01451 family)